MEFQFLTSPRIVFGPGAVDRLGEFFPDMGARVLLVLGGKSGERSGLRRRLQQEAPVEAMACCGREPTIAEVDHAVALAKNANCDSVVAAGGGSVLDCGKAAAAMLTNPGSLKDYLEGVGDGRAVEQAPCPMVAIPTTAGTGSEVTKNAVISGPGYKKSVRSPMMIPRVALVDPILTHTMPPAVTASCGMDALTQVLEPYLSLNASPLTDGLALQGVRLAGRFLRRAYEDPADAEAREGMAITSLLGGICLANAGLGAVHGFASPLGALFPIPHGVACAVMLAPVARVNLAASSGNPAEQRVRRRFARMAEALTGRRFHQEEEALQAGLDALEELRQALKIPTLGELGLKEEDLPAVVRGSRGSSMSYNPVELTDDQLLAALEAAL